jgi:L-rhamnose-H+ transport protein
MTIAFDDHATAVPSRSHHLRSERVAWYFQFFFYTMGETQMGRFRFSSWTLHMGSIIIFSTRWGVALKEWKGTSRRTHLFIAAGLTVLILSTFVIGYANYLNTRVGRR